MYEDGIVYTVARQDVVYGVPHVRLPYDMYEEGIVYTGARRGVLLQHKVFREVGECCR